MNNNKIDLAEIYGLNRREDTDIHSNMMNVSPPALEQLASVYNMQKTDNADTVNNTESINNIDNIIPEHRDMDDGVELEKCRGGRCRFDNYYDDPTQQNCISCQSNLMPIDEYNQPYPITAQNIQYLNTFIRSQVGRRVHVEFLIGTNNIVEKDGYLVAVGANFILLNPVDTKDMIACDFHNIKFMRFYY